MKIILIWIQWSWKWTQAKILKEKYGFKIYETWKFLREMASKDSELWKKIKSIIDSWRQVSPDVVEEILNEVMKDNHDKKLILDGFVRNPWNKLSVDKIIKNYKVLYLNLPEKEARERLLWRMYDIETWETFIAWTLINPKNWNKLVKRADDEENAVNERIRLFYEITMPVIEEYKKSWNIIEVNANWSIEDVSHEIEQKIKL